MSFDILLKICTIEERKKKIKREQNERGLGKTDPHRT